MGYDAHALEPGRKLVLAGVDVPFDRGLQGFSDADVAAHAVIDAVLGAAALGDCGSHFPAGDTRFAGARSIDLVGEAVALLQAAGFTVNNVDCTIVAEHPPLAPHIDAMRANLARALGVELGRVSIKAKRTEGLGFSGAGEGMEAYAVATVEQRP